MTTDQDTLLQFFDSSETSKKIDFPVILRTKDSTRCNNKNYTLRRNTPLTLSQSRKSGGRLVSKRGRVRVYFKKIPQKSLQYAKDLWNTLVDMQWRWLSLTVSLINVLAYLSCGALFYLDAWISGDFERKDETSRPCVKGIQNMWMFFMLGIETITTTGYGYVHPTEECSLYFVVLTYSTVINILIDGAFISVVYAKMNRPKERRLHEHMFTKKAVISLRNGKMSLVTRINDRDGKHKVNTNVRMFLIKDQVNDDGTITVNYITELEILPFGMLFWPVELIHEIGPKSPFWTISPDELMTEKLEVVVVVSGSSLKTGKSTTSQTSFLNKEIMWGYQFEQCLEYNFDKREYTVNKKLFHQTVSQEVPLCSAEMLSHLQAQMNSYAQSGKMECTNSNAIT